MADRKYQPTNSSSDDEYVQPTWNLRPSGRSSLSPPESPSPFVQQFRRRNSLSPLDSPGSMYVTTPRVNTPLGGSSGELSPTITQSIEAIPVPIKYSKEPKAPFYASTKRKQTGFQLSKGKKNLNRQPQGRPHIHPFLVTCNYLKLQLPKS